MSRVCPGSPRCLFTGTGTVPRSRSLYCTGCVQFSSVSSRSPHAHSTQGLPEHLGALEGQPQPDYNPINPKCRTLAEPTQHPEPIKTEMSR